MSYLTFNEDGILVHKLGDKVIAVYPENKFSLGYNTINNRYSLLKYGQKDVVESCLKSFKKVLSKKETSNVITEMINTINQIDFTVDKNMLENLNMVIDDNSTLETFLNTFNLV